VAPGRRERLVQAHRPAAAGQESELEVTVAEPRCLVGHHHVAGQQDLAPAGQGETVDDGHRNERRRLHLSQDVVQSSEDRGECTAVPQAVGLLEGGQDPGEIGTGAERPAPAPDDEHPGAALPGPAHGFLQPVDDGGADGVAGLGPVDGRPQDCAVVDQDHVAHPLASSLAHASRRATSAMRASMSSARARGSPTWRR
jgi:hypothetical protein